MYIITYTPSKIKDQSLKQTRGQVSCLVVIGKLTRQLTCASACSIELRKKPYKKTKCPCVIQ